MVVEIAAGCHFVLPGRYPRAGPRGHFIVQAHSAAPNSTAVGFPPSVTDPTSI